MGKGCVERLVLCKDATAKIPGGYCMIDDCLANMRRWIVRDTARRK